MALFVFSFIYLLQTSFAVQNTVPVFMIDQEQVMTHVQIDPNPFEKLTTTDFTDILYDSARQSAGVIIFVEETLSAEDISTKDKYGTCYTKLRFDLIQNKATYFPSVIEPYVQLKQIFQPEKNNMFYLPQHSKFLVPYNNYKYIYVYFQDGINETRADVLRRHDSLIKEVGNSFRHLKSGPIVAFYTGKRNPVVIKKLEFVKRTKNARRRNEGVLIVSSKAIFRLFGVYTVTATRRALYDRPPVISEETYTQRTLATKLNYPTFDLEFFFRFQPDSWVLDYVALFEGDEEVGRSSMLVGAPLHYSYFCPEGISVVNTRDGSTVTISQYHIEPKAGERRDTESKPDEEFGPAVHCAPFFTSNILACFMVTIICLLILFYGLMTLFDCVANDRYEDANSKPLIHEVLH